MAASPPIYQYRPIHPPDGLRMLRILPGADDTPIQIEISHHLLTDMDRCEALSYEWGRGERDQDILCEGSLIKGTPNLLIVLKRLRQRMMRSQGSELGIEGLSNLMSVWKRARQRARTTKGKLRHRAKVSESCGTGLLWIDGICMDQDDDNDKAAQLPLMGDIYRGALRVLIWVGEEPEHSEDVFRIIDLLDEAARNLDKIEESFFSVDETLELEPGVRIGQLAERPSWLSILDVLGSRSYFTRLWTIQEMVLSNTSTTLVLCGGNMCSWVAFCLAAHMIRKCEVLRLSMSDSNIEFTQNITRLRPLQDMLRQGCRSTLQICMATTATQQLHVSRNHDRVYALLGMLSDQTRSLLLPLKYDEPAERLFQRATSIMMLEAQDLDHFSEKHVLFDYPGTASWTAFSPFYLQADFPELLDDTMLPLEYPITFEDENQIPCPEYIPDDFLRPASLQRNTNVSTRNCSILVAKGFVLDRITTSFQNFSPGKFMSQLIAAYYTLWDDTFKDVKNSLKTVEKLWIAIALGMAENFDSSKERDEALSHFVAAFSKWIFNSNEIADVNKPPSAGGEPSSGISPVFRPEQQGPKLSQEDIDIFSRSPEIAHPTEVMEPQLFFETLHLYRKNEQVVLHFGRNLFISSKGYVGVGPMGDNREGALPAVRVGDEIMMLASLTTPIILRPHADGLYTLIGPAHLPEARGDPMLKLGNFPELVDVRVK